MMPTAWDVRNKLMAFLNAAKYSGEPYVDVESSNLQKDLACDLNAHNRTSIFHEVNDKNDAPR